MLSTNVELPIQTIRGLLLKESNIQLCHDSPFMSLYHVLLCLCFVFPCHTVSFKCLCSSLYLPLSVVLFPHVFSSMLLPFLTSPGLIPPLSPQLFPVLSLVSVYYSVSPTIVQAWWVARPRRPAARPKKNQYAKNKPPIN